MIKKPTFVGFLFGPNILYNWPMKKLNTFDFIQRSKQAHGDRYDYSRSEYLGSTSSILIGCPDHGDFMQIAAHHMNGTKCRQCGLEDRDAKLRLPKNVEIDKQRRAEVCDARTDRSRHKHLAKLREIHPTYEFPNYVENFEVVTSKVVVVCPAHGEFSATTHHLKKGKGCPECGKLKSAESRKKTAEDFEQFKQARYTYGKFQGWREKIEITCPKHGVFLQTPEMHQHGKGCGKCAFYANSLKSLIGPDELLRRAREKHGDRYDYISRPERVTDLWRIQCKDHGVFTQVVYSHLSGSNCPACARSGTSVGQEELESYIRDLGYEILTNYRFSKLHRRQLDMYLPSEGFAVEYHGLYWHSSAHKPDNYHVTKHLESKEVGITLYQIFEDEWQSKRMAVEALVADACGALPDVDGELYPSKINGVDARRFHNQFGLGKLTGADSHYAFFVGDEVVAVMSFTKGEKAKLVTYSYSHSVNLAPLFRFAVSDLGVKTVLATTDVRICEGSKLAALGFTKLEDTPPTYEYIKSNIYRRLPAKVALRAVRRLSGYNPDLPEWQSCSDAGYYQIYNCGYTNWSYSV